MGPYCTRNTGLIPFEYEVALYPNIFRQSSSFGSEAILFNTVTARKVKDCSGSYVVELKFWGKGIVQPVYSTIVQQIPEWWTAKIYIAVLFCSIRSENVVVFHDGEHDGIVRVNDIHLLYPKSFVDIEQYIVEGSGANYLLL
jgi:hypothetical protein